MKKSKFTKIVERIAKENCVSTADVRRDMEGAIEVGYENRNKDENTRLFWGQWGRKPTPEEFIMATAKKTEQDYRKKGDE